MSLFSKFANVGLATFSSRLFGLIREIMMAAILATGPIADIFYTCFRLPNLFRAFFAEGAFNIAFVPIYAKALEKDKESKNKNAAKKLSSEIFAVLASWLILFTSIALIFMPFIVANILAPGFADTPDKLSLSITMTKIMFPYLIFMSLAAMFAGILNCLQRYFLAAFAPIFLNITLIAALFIISQQNISNNSENIGIILSFAVLIAGFLQLAVLFFGLWQENMHFSLVLPKFTPNVKKLLYLMTPALLTGGVLQINLLIGTIIATSQDGANALLNYADRINQLPLGIIGIAISVVLLPELTRALQKNKQKNKNKKNDAEAQILQNKAIEFACLFSLPCCFAFLIMPNEIISLIYQRGAFTADIARQTAEILFAFAVALPAFILTKALQPAFFARENMKIPLILSCFMLIINASLSLALFPSLGAVAIAIATSIAGWVNFILHLVILIWQKMFLPTIICIKRILLIFCSAIIMAIILYICVDLLPDILADSPFLLKFWTVLALVFIGFFSYFASIIALFWLGNDREFIFGFGKFFYKNVA